MAIDTTELKSLYDEFLTKGMSELKKLQEATQMEDESLATAASNIIIGAMSQSTQSLQVIKGFLLLDKQIVTEANKALDIASATAVRDAQSTQDLLNKASERIRIDKSATLVGRQADSETNKALDIASATAARDAQLAKDLLIKDEQYIAAKLTTGNTYFDYTYYVSTDQEVIDGLASVGDVKTKTLATTGVAKSTQELTQEKLNADVNFVKEQEKQLGYSVIYNNRIKAMQDYSDTLGNLGVGGFVITTDMWKIYKNMLEKIYINSGSSPVDYSPVLNADGTEIALAETVKAT